MIYGPYNATVTEIHDGDTVRMNLYLESLFKDEQFVFDFGFGIIFNLKPDTTLNLACRFYGINAPELSTDAGKKSRDYLKSLLPDGSVVQAMSYGWDKYGGRFDGVVVYNGVNLNEKMVADGYAKRYAT